MRLKLNRVCSLKDFQLVMGLYRGHPFFFLEYVIVNVIEMEGVIIKDYFYTLDDKFVVKSWV